MNCRQEIIGIPNIFPLNLLPHICCIFNSSTPSHNLCRLHTTPPHHHFLNTTRIFAKQGRKNWFNFILRRHFFGNPNPSVPPDPFYVTDIFPMNSSFSHETQNSNRFSHSFLIFISFLFPKISASFLSHADYGWKNRKS